MLDYLHRKKYLKQTILVGAILINLSACSNNEVKSTIGEEFLTSNLKIKSNISVAGQGTLTLECYIDGDGDGEGLLRYNSEIYNIGINSDKVYVKVSDTLTVELSDITGHLIVPNSNLLSVDALKDMTLYGFKIVDNQISSYTSSIDTTKIETQFSSASNEFDSVAYTTERSVSVNTLANLLNEQQNTSNTVVKTDTEDTDNEEENEEEETKDSLDSEVESFYNNFNTGVQIKNTVFSISDTCNPSDYYFNLTPEGINQKIEYSQDNRVTVKYISYNDKEGKITFATIGGYVRSIYTTCEFKWCGINYGMTKDELDTYCGLNLSNKEREESNFKIAFSGLEYVKKSGKTYYFTINDLTGEVTIGDENTVEQLYVRKTLDYEQYSN